jgi:hypothetical protein
VEPFLCQALVFCIELSFCTEIMCATAGKRLIFYYVFVLNQSNNRLLELKPIRQDAYALLWYVCVVWCRSYCIPVVCVCSIVYADLDLVVDADVDVAVVVVVSIFQIPKV